MVRRNTTHLSRLARAVADSTGRPYAQMLELVRTQHAAGRLPSRWDAHSMSLASAHLIHLVTFGPHPVTTPYPALYDEDGHPLVLGLQNLSLHTLIVGAPDAGVSEAAGAVTVDALRAGADVAAITRPGPSVRFLEQLSADEGASFAVYDTGRGFQSGRQHTMTELEQATVTCVALEATGVDAGVELGQVLRDLIAGRLRQRPTRPLIVVLDPFDVIPAQVALELFSRGRASAVSMVGVSSGLSQLGPDHRSVLANAGILLALRQDEAPPARPATGVSAHPAGSTLLDGELAGELTTLPAGQGLCRMPDGHVRRFTVGTSSRPPADGGA